MFQLQRTQTLRHVSHLFKVIYEDTWEHSKGTTVALENGRIDRREGYTK